MARSIEIEPSKGGRPDKTTGAGAHPSLISTRPSRCEGVTGRPGPPARAQMWIAFTIAAAVVAMLPESDFHRSVVMTTRRFEVKTVIAIALMMVTTAALAGALVRQEIRGDKKICHYSDGFYTVVSAYANCPVSN